MPDLAISKGVRRRQRGSLRPSVLFNMFLEKDDDAPDGFARMSRQGISPLMTVGSGPIHGMYAEQGVFDGDIFSVSDGTLYRGEESLSELEGAAATSFAASSLELVVTRGSRVLSYNGSNAAYIAMPDDVSVTAAAYLGGYFIYLRRGSHRFYWSASQNGRSVDAFDFASAESAPDELLDVYVVNDGLWFMGSTTTEFWQLTGNPDAPFARVEGILLKKGLIATGCAAEADNTLFWWGHDNMIYRAAEGAPQRVSDNDIEEALERSAAKAMFSYSYEGHVWVVVRTDIGTFGLDVSTGVWSEMGTHGRIGWRIRNSAVCSGEPVFGDDESGTIWHFDDANWDDGDVLERRLSASFSLPGGSLTVHRLCLLGNPGDTPLLTGEGADPVIEIRSSRDNGKTWGAYRPASLGEQGRYRQRIEKRRWGLFDTSGGVFEMRVTDPVPVRISRAYANEPSGGRASRS